jgi:enamine deaminase RidA (YjgF/YER057c/UK114 family)
METSRTVEGVHPPRGYSHYSRQGDTVYVAGQIALDPRGELVGRGDIEAQTRQVYVNLRLVLEHVGLSLHDIVKTTVLLTDAQHIETFRTVRSEVMGDHLPSSTLLVVTGLALPDLLVEIEAIAGRAATSAD